MTNQILRKAAATAAVVPGLFGLSGSAQAVIVCETHTECAMNVYPCVSYSDGTGRFLLGGGLQGRHDLLGGRHHFLLRRGLC
jgi:hypothetical protein